MATELTQSQFNWLKAEDSVYKARAILDTLLDISSAVYDSLDILYADLETAQKDYDDEQPKKDYEWDRDQLNLIAYSVDMGLIDIFNLGIIAYMGFSCSQINVTPAITLKFNGDVTIKAGMEKTLYTAKAKTDSAPMLKIQEGVEKAKTIAKGLSNVVKSAKILKDISTKQIEHNKKLSKIKSDIEELKKKKDAN
ncbi:hypothetical protein FACS1894190_03930 [Spirochaetia bacterium]|nr:hypothetical protein FACS1894190_03930 [Spirochaetia bacterium]